MTFSFMRANRTLTEALGMLEEMRKKDDDLNSKEYFTEGNPESFFLMNETCQLVEEIVTRRVREILDSAHIATVTHQSAPENAKGDLLEEWEDKRNEMMADFIQEIKKKLTYPFRKALNGALDEKHAALDALKSISKQAKYIVIANRTKRPPRDTPEPTRYDEDEEP
jgi:hypothetical protein